MNIRYPLYEGVYRILTGRKEKIIFTLDKNNGMTVRKKGMVSYPASTMTAQTGNRFTLVWGHIYSKVK